MTPIGSVMVSLVQLFGTKSEKSHDVIMKPHLGSLYTVLVHQLSFILNPNIHVLVALILLFTFFEFYRTLSMSFLRHSFPHAAVRQHIRPSVGFPSPRPTCSRRFFATERPSDQSKNSRWLVSLLEYFAMVASSLHFIPFIGY